MTAYLTTIHALSALHAGTGQGSGVIDLPIAREKATGLPYLPGSSFKGVLRTLCPNEDMRRKIFGSDDPDGTNASAGTVQITDQRLLLLPVRSLAGTFAWVTSPYILRRLARDLADLGASTDRLRTPEVPNLQTGLVANETSCLIIAVPDDKPAIYLEEVDLVAQADESVHQWATWLGPIIFPDEQKHGEWRQELYTRLCVVHDDLLRFFLRTTLEVIARIRLQEDSKTVVSGGLWYEEALPAETILSGLALIAPREQKGVLQLTEKEIKDELDKIATHPLQLGGKATVGRGLCRGTILAIGGR